MNKNKNITTNNNYVPWYFGRKFWGGVLLLTPILMPCVILSLLARPNNIKALSKPLWFCFNALPEITLISFGGDVIKKGEWLFILPYYLIIGLFLFLGFRKKRVKIIFPIIIITITAIDNFFDGF